MELKQSLVVIGCARSGIGAAKLGQQRGYAVTLYDQKPMQHMSEEVQHTIQELITLGISFEAADTINLSRFNRIVVSPGVPLDLPFIEEAAKRGQEIIGEFEFAYECCQAPIAAITGTNGKTTTTALVGEIIKRYNAETFVVGNIGRAFSEDVLSIPEQGIVVAEASSFQLETTKQFHPMVAALLNITPDHLNRHKTMENYCEAKYQVTAHQDATDFFIVNGQDPYYKEACSKSKAQIVTFDVTEKVGFGTFLEEDRLYCNMSGQQIEICKVNELKILGKHNIENALAAIAICKGMNVPETVIREGLLAFKGVEHRIEYVATKSNVDYYNDSKATNVGAAIPGLLAMQKPVHLIAGGMDKTTTFDEWIQYFAGRVKKVYVIGETKKQIIDECHAHAFEAVEAFETFEEAIQKAAVEANKGDCVLLSPACASWDMFESYEQRGELFKTIVNQLEG